MNCEIFFITYDEPQADHAWQNIKTLLPEAKRVHGVKGFDAAYKACAAQSNSSRFFTIDGDNELLPQFLELRTDLSQAPEHAVLSWSAKNSINGLSYGNGGVKNWPKSVVDKMKTHEQAENKDAAVDFCFQLNYLQMPETLSTARIHDSPYQAFRAGFREGVKMCLERGIKPEFIPGLSKSEIIHTHIWHENLDRLKIWCSVGADVKNGEWSIFGARLGCKMLCLSDWDHDLIRDYDWFRFFWEEKIAGPIGTDSFSLHNAIDDLGNELNRELELGIILLDSQSSAFFKSVYINPPRKGPMFK